MRKANLVGALAFALAAAGPTASTAVSAAELLVLEKGVNDLAFVDPGSLKVTGRVPSGPDPHEVIASSDGTRAYISNYGGEGGSLHIISVVDLTTHKALPPIDLGAFHSAHGLDFQGGKLYFTAETNRVVGRYDPAAGTIDWALGIGQGRTHMIIVAKDLEHIYTSNVSSGTIGILEERMRPRIEVPPGFKLPADMPLDSLEARKIWEVTNVPSGKGSEGFDISPDGRQIWAANAEDGTVTVISVADKKAVETFPIPLQLANRLKFTKDGRYVFVSGLGALGTQTKPTDNNLIVLDAASHKLVKGFNLGGGSAGILMAPDGSRAYVAVSFGGKVAVIDLHSLQLSGQVALHEPDGMAWR